MPNRVIILSNVLTSNDVYFNMALVRLIMRFLIAVSRLLSAGYQVYNLSMFAACLRAGYKTQTCNTESPLARGALSFKRGYAHGGKWFV